MNRPFFAFAALAAMLVGAPALASTVVIWPVDPVIKPGEQATAIWLENTGDKPVTLQVRSFIWSQAEGDDALAPQDDVVASPPIVSVQPGKRQLVRVIRRVVPVAGTAAERSYRLIIDELPTATTPGDPGSASARLAVQMRYSIPLFTYAADPAAQQPNLLTAIRATNDGRILEIRNTGTLHARLTDLRVVTNGREQMVKPGLAGYVLPGATVRFQMSGSAPGTIKVGVNGKDETLSPGA
jgi:fimbrial chaperone protein